MFRVVVHLRRLDANRRNVTRYLLESEIPDLTRMGQTAVANLAFSFFYQFCFAFATAISNSCRFSAITAMAAFPQV